MIRIWLLHMIFLLPLTFGCVAQQHSADASAWESFIAFSAQLQSESQGYSPEDFHSSEVLEELVDFDEMERNEILVSREFPRYFESIEGHYEQSLGLQVCLVVNGVTIHGDYASLFLELVPEQGKLKFGEALVHYVDTPDEWLTGAECPQAFLEKLDDL